MIKIEDDDDEPKEVKALKHKARMHAHEELLIAHISRIKRIYADHNHLCHWPGCDKAGSLSHGTTGGGYFHCLKHFRETS